MSQNEALSDVLDRPRAVFSKGLGTIKGFKADIKIQDGAQPEPGQYLMHCPKK